jgi:sugar phosphate isomerase/epimerase
MQFGTGYFGPERNYYTLTGASVADAYIGTFPGNKGPNIEGTQTAQVGVKELGMSVTEGSRFGSLVQTTSQAIRLGVGKIELATIQGGSEPGGAEGYGHEARLALRELAKANTVSYTSVHTPANTVGNLSGYNYQERGFNDEYRHRSMEEVKKAIQLAGDVGAGAVVVHTGEALRDISSAPWNKEVAPGVKQFLSYEEEPGRQVLYMVDDRTGKLITEVRKSQVVYEPQFKTKFNPETGFEEYIDKDGKFLDEREQEDLFNRVPEWDSEKVRFKTERRDWTYFQKLAERWNKKYPRKNMYGDSTPWTPEELFFRKQLEMQILQARGSSLYHGRMYDDYHKGREELLKAMEYYKKLEGSIPKEELWKIMRDDPKMSRYIGGGEFVGSEKRLPTQIIKDALIDVERQMKYTHEASSAADANADQYSETIKHVQPVHRYAKDKTSWSYAQAGIMALEETKKNPHAKQDIFVAPENLFPEMGYGTHPDELIELVTQARRKMVELLTKKEIPNPYELRDKEGDLQMINNPYYQGMNEVEAKKMAEKHIKATFDTQHLGMWWAHFQPKPGETMDQRRARFEGWYKEQVQKLEKSGIIGHIHAVDAMGAGHHHLPIGEGNLPVKWTLEYLKSKGYKGTMISEGWEENRVDPGRQLTASWRHLGTNIGSGFAVGAPSRAWQDVQFGYFNQMQSPYFIFGSYSPSNDWQLWSQVPLE